jgi:TRAP-type uncharacterized transport system substrate-binding protein
MTALVLAALFYFHSPGPQSYRLSITAGEALGMRHQLAQRLRKEIFRHGLEFTLHPCEGSEEALDWVNTRNVDLGLVQGGLSASGRPNVRQVATLHIEPIHLAVKKELAPSVSASLLALRAKTVDLGKPGTGTHSLALAILDFVGLQPRDRDPVHGYTPLNLDRQQLYAEQDTSRLPDAVFLVVSLPSSTIHYLVARHGYRLVPLPFAEALALESLERPGTDDAQESGEGHVVLGRIQSTIIPAYTYGIEPPVPDKPLPTIGTRLLVVAHKDVPPRAVFQLVEGTYASEFGQLVHPHLDARLMDLPPEFPWHDGALLYQHRNAPLLSGAVMDSAHKAFAILAAVVTSLFVLWQWSKSQGTLTRNRGFKEYIAQVAHIEERALEAERTSSLALSELFALRDRVRRLKTEALKEFARRDLLVDKDLLFGFLVQVNDARDYLSRLILQSEESESKV